MIADGKNLFTVFLHYVFAAQFTVIFDRGKGNKLRNTETILCLYTTLVMNIQSSLSNFAAQTITCFRFCFIEKLKQNLKQEFSYKQFKFFHVYLIFKNI